MGMLSFYLTCRAKYYLPLLLKLNYLIIRLLPEKTLRLSGEAPFFIIGSGRNGSTLLACLLNNHANVFIPPEQSAMVNGILKWQRWRVHPTCSWEQFVTDFVSTLSKRSLYWKIDFQEVSRELKSLNPQHRNFQNILITIYQIYGKMMKREVVCWGDKTPGNTAFVKLWKEQFPKSKFVFLIRDPRDVILSLLKVNYNYYYARLHYRIWLWADGIRKYEWLCMNYPEDVILLSYERLVSSSELEVQRVVKWLGLPMQEGLTIGFQDNIENMGVKGVGHHLNLENQINADSVNRWVNELDPKIADLIYRKLKGLLIKYHYA